MLFKLLILNRLFVDHSKLLTLLTHQRDNSMRLDKTNLRIRNQIGIALKK
jgi:hypothetical protein